MTREPGDRPRKWFLDLLADCSTSSPPPVTSVNSIRPQKAVTWNILAEKIYVKRRPTSKTTVDLPDSFSPQFVSSIFPTIKFYSYLPRREWIPGWCCPRSRWKPVLVVMPDGSVQDEYCLVIFRQFPKRLDRVEKTGEAKRSAREGTINLPKLSAIAQNHGSLPKRGGDQNGLMPYNRVDQIPFDAGTA